MFKVSEIAKKLGKTKDSVYKKSSRLKHELDGHKKKLNGIIYYDEEGFEIIKNSYDIPIVDDKSVQSVQSRQHYDDNKYLELLLSEKDKQIEHLKEQLSEKDKSLEQAMELVKNNQMLLLQSQQQVLMLKTSEISENDQRKSFWSRIWKTK